MHILVEKRYNDKNKIRLLFKKILFCILYMLYMLYYISHILFILRI